jgi:hypothetical protein
MKAVEAGADWCKFLIDVETLLKSVGAKYYIKEDLRNVGLRGQKRVEGIL